MSDHDSKPNVASSDRRSSSRESAPGSVQIKIESTSLTATLENRSDEGMLVLVDGSLEVQVTLGEGGSEEHALARLTRVAALPGQRSGWGLELIDDSSAH